MTELFPRTQEINVCINCTKDFAKKDSEYLHFCCTKCKENFYYSREEMKLELEKGEREC